MNNDSNSLNNNESDILPVTDLIKPIQSEFSEQPVEAPIVNEVPAPQPVVESVQPFVPQPVVNEVPVSQSVIPEPVSNNSSPMPGVIPMPSENINSNNMGASLFNNPQPPVTSMPENSYNQPVNTQQSIKQSSKKNNSIIIIIVILVLILGGGAGFIAYKNMSKPEVEKILIEDFQVGMYGCGFDDKCTLSEGNILEDNLVDYEIDKKYDNIFEFLIRYKEYIKLNVYYVQKGDIRSIIEYKVYLKSNNEDITNIETEEKLREKLGLYNEGTYTDTLTLTNVGDTGFAVSDDKSYAYREYTFKDSKGTEYKMHHILANGELGITVGNQYSVTFEVKKDVFGYEFNINSIN